MKTVYLHLNSRDEFMRVDISKIVYFESDGNYTKFVLINKLQGIVAMNLSHMQQTLNNSLKENAIGFIRVGKKHIINSRYVFKFSPSRQIMLLSDGENFAYKLEISKSALKQLRELYLQSLNNTQITDNNK
ncbi:MAG: LytTR family transcriptional regulator [Bacteroidaceae bacterium]|nr:LytTR family transcriptional regulator [Bacteroidaceae bacterium]